MPLNSSNPEELNAQLAAFLEQQKQAEEADNAKTDSSMPVINGRNVASNNLSTKTKKDSSDPFMKKYNQKSQGSSAQPSSVKALDLKNQARHRTQNRKNSPTVGDL